jgi:hypothetical protein
MQLAHTAAMRPTREGSLDFSSATRVSSLPPTARSLPIGLHLTSHQHKRTRAHSLIHPLTCTHARSHSHTHEQARIRAQPAHAQHIQELLQPAHAQHIQELLPQTHHEQFSLNISEFQKLSTPLPRLLAPPPPSLPPLLPPAAAAVKQVGGVRIFAFAPTWPH